MNSTVPTSMPDWVMFDSFPLRQMPKSSSFTLPSSSTMMLAGLRSRCTSPFWCTRERALHTWRPMRTPSW